VNPQNIFAPLPAPSPTEIFTQLLDGQAFKLQRIVSTGQTSPPGQWYDQDTHEWVLLLSGGARLRIDGEAGLLQMQPGDYVHIPAHVRHRVEWTDPNQETVWLALHYQPHPADPQGTAAGNAGGL